MSFSAIGAGAKPTRQTGVNWGSPLANGLSGLWAFTEGGGPPINLVTRKAAVASGTPVWISQRYGKTVSFGATTDRYNLGTDTELLETDRVTILVMRRKTDVTNRVSSMFGTSGTNAQRCGTHCPFSDGIVYWDFGGATAPNRLTASGLSFAGYQRWAFVAGPRGSSIWLDGARVANQTTAVTRSTGGTAFYINSGNDPVTPPGAGDLEEMTFVATLKTEWTDERIIQWMSDPFCLLSRQPLTVWFTTAQLISPNSIASAEVVGSPSLLLNIAPATIPSAEVVGSPTIIGATLPGAPTGYQLFIASVDRTPYLRQDTLSVRMALNERASASLELLDSVSGVYRPVVGQPIEFWMGTDKRFAGLIQDIEERNENGTSIFYYPVNCGDYTSILDRRTVTFVYDVTYGTLAAIVNDIITRVLEGEGFGIGTVSSAVTMAAGDKLEFNGITVKQAFDKLAEFFSVDGYRVDFDKNVHFRNFAAVAAPYNLTDGSAHALSNTIKVRQALTDYANRIGLRTSGGIAPLWCDTITGTRSVKYGNVLDSVQQFFITTFRLSKTPRVRVNGTDQVVVELSELGTSSTWQWYWINDGYGVQQKFSATPLTASDTLEICYPTPFPSILYEQSDSEIAARKAIEGGTGIYEAVVDLADVPSYQTAQTILDGLLARRGVVNKTVEWQSQSQGWEPGQSLTINLTKPLVGSDTFLLDTVSFSEREGSLRALAPFLWYALKASSGQALGSSSRWFDKIVASMSKAKDRVYEIVSFWINTPLATGTNITTVAPRGMSDGIAAIVSVTLTDSTGAAITGTVQKTIFDINRNGTSIFGTTKLEVSIGASSGDQAFFIADPLYVSEGDVYTLDCDQLATFTGDVYCNVNLKIIRT